MKPEFSKGLEAPLRGESVPVPYSVLATGLVSRHGLEFGTSQACRDSATCGPEQSLRLKSACKEPPNGFKGALQPAASQAYDSPTVPAAARAPSFELLRYCCSFCCAQTCFCGQQVEICMWRPRMKSVSLAGGGGAPVGPRNRQF